MRVQMLDQIYKPTTLAAHVVTFGVYQPLERPTFSVLSEGLEIINLPILELHFSEK